MQSVLIKYLILFLHCSEIEECDLYCSRQAEEKIREKIGGGGHQTISGAQFREKTVDEVKELVKNAIKQYLEEAE